MARERSEFSGAMLASTLLHAGVIVAAMISWPWARQLPMGAAVPVNIVANAPSTNLAPAEQGPEELPAQTEAAAMEDPKEPLTVSIRQDGTVFIQEDAVPFASLAPRLRAMSGDDRAKPIYVRADGRASYEIVAQVMAALSTSGFTSINLITDTGGPSSGGEPR